jgi:16S rRNA (guanine527-N7)-methyltransferase
VSGESWGNLPVPPDPLHRSAYSDESLQLWLRAVVETPGLTAITDLEEARRHLLEDSLRGVGVVREFEGTIVDVGSGGGVPGIPLAASLPDREVTLLEATRRKVEFLEQWAQRLPNLRVVWGRAEEQGTDRFGVAVAKALAPPAVALEWCLPLVAPRGAAILWVGESAAAPALAAVAEQLGSARPEVRDGLLVFPKLRPTPPGFPRRVGVARKRPLA